jgi:hypothetical protein
LPGQGKTNPHFVFGDHVLTRHNSVFYDPSYGVRMAEDPRAYEAAAIAGLGLWKDHALFDQGVGINQTPQLITGPCSKGWMEVVYDGTANLEVLATGFGIADWKTLYDHRFNAALKALRKANPLQAGDKVYVPRDLATKNFELLKWEYL